MRFIAASSASIGFPQAHFGMVRVRMDNENALWAERAMYDTVAMSVANGISDLPCEAKADIERQRFAALL